MTFTEMEGTNSAGEERGKGASDDISRNTTREREEGGGILVGKLGAKGDRFGDYRDGKKGI